MDEDYHRVQANPPPAVFIRSFCYGLGGKSIGLDGEWDEDDVNPATRVDAATGTRYTQIPAVHEFGHLLGLPHPGVAGTPTEYTADAAALMGIGSAMRPPYYQKWVSYLDTRYPDNAPFNAVVF